MNTAPTTPRSRVRFGHTAGLTLLEVLVGMAVLTITSGSILAGLLQGRRVAERNLMDESAFVLAQSYLEDLKGISYESLTDDSTYEVRGGGFTEGATAVRTVDIRGTPATTGDDLRVELKPVLTASPVANTDPARPVAARNIVLQVSWRLQASPASTVRTREFRVIRSECKSYSP